MRTNSIFPEYEGRTINNCVMHLGERINLDPTKIGFCHELAIKNKPIEVIKISDTDKFDVAQYYRKMGKLIELFQNEDFPCVHCPLCINEEFHLGKIKWVTINTSEYCNSSCIYCRTHFGEKGKGYNPLPIIKAFDAEDLFDEKCLFDWGGGEPTQNPYFADTVEFLIKRKHFQRINTNAIEFSKAAYEALKNGNANLRISIDSGSRECFERVKGHPFYDEVWYNLGKYCSVSSDIDVKYNIFNLNSDKNELDIFLEKCNKANVKNIHIDAEIRSYQPIKNAGPFYFTEKEFKAVHYLYESGQDAGFNVVISPYAFSSRPEYEDGKLVLPRKYFDNIDHEVLSNNICITPYANMEGFEKEIMNDLFYGIVGKGIYTELVGWRLSKHGVEYKILDNVDEIPNMGVDCGKKLAFVLFNDGWEETLKKINGMSADVQKVAWLLSRSVMNQYGDMVIEHPLPDVKENSRVALYAFGNVGKSYYQQIRNNKKYTLMYIVDKNYVREADDDFGVKRIEDISMNDFDFIIVAVARKSMYEEIKKELLFRGIPEDKIVYNYKSYGIKLK